MATTRDKLAPFRLPNGRFLVTATTNAVGILPGTTQQWATNKGEQIAVTRALALHLLGQRYAVGTMPTEYDLTTNETD